MGSEARPCASAKVVAHYRHSGESRNPGLQKTSPETLDSGFHRNDKDKKWAATLGGARTPQAQSGFTLIEVLVALAVFSVAALALLNLETVTLTNTTRIADRTIGQIVARNVAVEALTDPVPPAQGVEAGRETNGGREWVWTRITQDSPEARILQINVSVANEVGDTVAGLTVFRFAAQ